MGRRNLATRVPSPKADRASLVLTASDRSPTTGPDGRLDVVELHRAVEAAAQSFLVALSCCLSPAVAVA